MKSKFKQFFICDQCDTRFIELPKENCPICIEFKEVSFLIENMNTEEEYRKIKKRINKLKDCIPKFDLFNHINRRRKDIKV